MERLPECTITNALGDSPRHPQLPFQLGPLFDHRCPVRRTTLAIISFPRQRTTLKGGLAALESSPVPCPTNVNALVFICYEGATNNKPRRATTSCSTHYWRPRTTITRSTKDSLSTIFIGREEGTGNTSNQELNSNAKASCCTVTHVAQVQRLAKDLQEYTGPGWLLIH